MPKLTRVFQKQFAQDAGPSDIGKYGSLAAGSPAYTTDPVEMQELDEFLEGWASETIANERPALEDFNALDYLLFYQLRYIFENGVPEWDDETTYYEGGLVNVEGVLYRSIVNDNINNEPTASPSEWEEAFPEFIPSVANALPGSVIGYARAEDGSYQSGTGTVPFDNSEPLETDGNLFESLSYTPKLVGSKLLIEGLFCGGCSSSDRLIAFLTIGSGAIASGWEFPAANQVASIPVSKEITTSSLDPITINLRAGVDSSGTTISGGADGSAKMNGRAITSITVLEIKPPA